MKDGAYINQARIEDSFTRLCVSAEEGHGEVVVLVRVVRASAEESAASPQTRLAPSSDRRGGVQVYIAWGGGGETGVNGGGAAGKRRHRSAT
jgi:hypothetical protein